MHFGRGWLCVLRELNIPRQDNTVVLLDGMDIASLMIEHGIGTTRVGTYVVNRLDSDYFLEE